MERILNSNQIKVIAIIAMTVDHLTWALFPGTQAVWYVYMLHITGRLTAPIMWFFIAAGCPKTHNIYNITGKISEKRTRILDRQSSVT